MQEYLKPVDGSCMNFMYFFYLLYYRRKRRCCSVYFNQLRMRACTNRNMARKTTCNAFIYE